MQNAAGGKAETLKTEILKGPTLNYAANGWKPVGSSADITCFSFYATKGITTGEGGMACTQRDEYAERMRVMSLHGISNDAWERYSDEASWYYEIVAPGFKYNLTDIAAAIGIHQLRRADEMHRKRAQWAALYSELLGDVEELVLPEQQTDRIHSWHLYSIRLRLGRLRINRAQVIEELKRRGITASVHWMPLHEHPYYREKYGYKPEDFPVAARLYPELITLPLYPDMTEGEVGYVCEAVKGVLKGKAKVQSLKSEVRSPKSEGQGRRTEDGRRRTEDGRRKTDYGTTDH
jgi:perosamine synthetase